MSALTMRLVRDHDGGTRHVPAPYVPPARGRKPRATTPPDPIATDGEASSEHLRQIIERIESVAEEVRAAQDDLKDVYSEAKAVGFDVSTLRQIVKLRRMEKHHRDEAEALLDTYRCSLGMA